MKRIEEALNAAAVAISPLVREKPEAKYKFGGDPVTEADRIANCVLREALPQDGEGWLSEESADDPRRLNKDRLWIVDPIDGTREYVAGIPEWCISVGMIENGRAVAGGICNPCSGEIFLGALGEGVSRNGNSVQATQCQTLQGAVVLASRTEVARGDWGRHEDAPFVTRAVGSVAYKLAMVAAGMADATWTLAPKHEWDVAAGVALILAAGGSVRLLDGSEPRFNNAVPLFPGLVACSRQLENELAVWIRAHAPSGTT